MKIISYRHIKPKETFCNHCGAELEYTPHDVKHKQFSGATYKIITCPVCGKTITIKE